MTTTQAESLIPPDLERCDSVTKTTPSRFELRKRSIFLFAAIVVSLLYFYSQGQLTQENLKQIGVSLPTWLFLPAYLILPLFGFPISIALLASGLKYGFLLSIAIAAVGMGFHTFAAWNIAHGYFRERLEAWLSSTRFDLPTIADRHQIWFTSLFVTVPGLPYAVKLYSLALTNLPFRRYFPIVWFFHVANSVLFIGLGAAAANVDARLLIGLAVLSMVVVAVTNWLRKFASGDVASRTRPMQSQSLAGVDTGHSSLPDR